MKHGLVCILLLWLVAVESFGQQVRIVTAGSALTETVCALGDCEKIVATDKTSLYPEQVQALPSIGYRSGINAEGIIALKPSIFFVEKNYVDAAVVQQVRSTGITVVEVERAYDVAGTRDLIRAVALPLGRERQAEELIKKIEKQLDEAAAIAAKAKYHPKVLCIYNRGTASFDVAGAHTFSAILPMVNAVPAITSVEGFKPLNAEAILAANPDFLLMFESGVKSLGGVDGVLRVPGVAQTSAGKKRQIIAMDGGKLSNFGPRLGEAAKELAVSLYTPTK